MAEDRGTRINRIIAREFLVFLFAYGLPLVLWVVLLSLSGSAETGREEAGRGAQLLTPLLVYLPVQLIRLFRHRSR